MEIEELERLAKQVGRVVIPIGDYLRAKCGPPPPGSAPEPIRMVAGVQWAQMMNGEVVFGEVLAPVDTAGNFTAAVQQARKEVEVMFETYFPKPVVEVKEPAPSKPKAPKPPARQLESTAAPTTPAEPVTAAPAPVTPVDPSKPKEPLTPPPRSATPLVQAVPRPAAVVPATTPDPDPVGAETGDGPDGDEPSGPQMTVEGAGNFEVNLPCKYANKKLRDLGNPDAVSWFATHEKTKAPEYANLRLAAAIWYDHLVATGQAKPKA